MISKKLSTPGLFWGTEVNCDKTHVLLQLTDLDSQVRVMLTSVEVDKLIIELEKRKSQLNDQK